MSTTPAPKPSWRPDPRTALPETRLTPEQVLQRLLDVLGTHAIEHRIPADWRENSGPAFRQIWIRLHRDGLHDAVRALVDIHYPHLVVIAAEDRGDTIDLPYILRLYHGERHAEIMVVLTAVLPKADPRIDTITDLIPGALISEREKQEMIGVTVNHIPDGRRMFLPDDFPEGVYPWRRDETGIPPDMIRNLWATGREGLDARDAERRKAAEEQAALQAEADAAAALPVVSDEPETPQPPAES